MTSYRIGPLLLSSNRPLPEVPRAPSAEPDWHFHVCRTPPRARRDAAWFHCWRLPDGRVWLSLGRREREYLLRFTRLADFVLNEDDRRIDCYPVARTAPATVRHLLLDQVMPLVFSARPSLVLHASAVRAPAGAVGFVGLAGAGKSTLAVSLARTGWDLVSDDCLLLDADGRGVRAMPTYPSARLWDDSLRALYGTAPGRLAPVAQYTRKRRLGPGTGRFRFCEEPLPLVRLYVLTPGRRAAAGGRLTGISRREAMVELLRFTFHLDVTDAEALAVRFRLAGQVAGQVAIRALALPSGLDGLVSVRRLLEDDLKM
ncbi:MAG TPA: hypothetical protein VNE16_13380 [Vicinamibacterales bacterium]|nr:hypothetical protein [Vicinamibacterales bacterium]